MGCSAWGTCVYAVAAAQSGSQYYCLCVFIKEHLLPEHFGLDAARRTSVHIQQGLAGECVFIKIHLATRALRLDAAKGPSEVQCSEYSPTAPRLLSRLLRLCVS